MWGALVLKSPQVVDCLHSSGCEGIVLQKKKLWLVGDDDAKAMSIHLLLSHFIFQGKKAANDFN